jgi:hypothetical protein
MRIIIEDGSRKEEQASFEAEKTKYDAGSAPSSLISSARIEPTAMIESAVNGSNIIDAGPVPQSLIDTIQGTIPPTKRINNELESDAGAAPEF